MSNRHVFRHPTGKAERSKSWGSLGGKLCLPVPLHLARLEHMVQICIGTWGAAPASR